MNDAASPVVSWSGSVIGPNPPASGKVIVYWELHNGPGYYWGDGTYGGSTFTISFATPPPPGAINWNYLGVGWIILVDSGFAEPTGLIANSVLAAHALGLSGQAVIWRDASLSSISWMGAFPDGYGVGMCCSVPGTFDGFVPVDPSTLTVFLFGAPGQPAACNWT